MAGRSNIFRLGGLLLLLGAALLPRAGEAKPARIVSTNVCTDQLLMQMAEPEAILSLSFLARDPENSAMAAEAMRFPVNYGSAEEIIRLRPDLILAGEYTTRATIQLLKKLGLNVLEFPLAHTLADVRTAIRRLADAIGEETRGDQLIASFEAALPPGHDGAPPKDAPIAALYWANGLTSGDDTLAGAILRAAGFRNLAGVLDIPGNGQIPLERLIRADPDVVITGEGESPRTPSLATEKLHHPALKKAFAGKLAGDISSTAWVCGTPRVAEAIRSLHAFRLEHFSAPRVTWEGLE